MQIRFELYSNYFQILYCVPCIQIQNVNARQHQQQAGVRLDKRPVQRGNQRAGFVGAQQKEGISAGTGANAVALFWHHRRPPTGNSQHLPVHKPSNIISHSVQQGVQRFSPTAVRCLPQGNQADLPQCPHTSVPLSVSPHNQQEPPL